MAATLSAVQPYAKSKLDLYLGEFSLLSRALDIPRSFVNMVYVFPLKNSLTSKAFSYTAWIWSKVWHYGSSCQPDTNISSSEEKKNSEKNESAHEGKDELRVCTITSLSSSTIRSLYLYVLEHNFLGITEKSLELLRYNSEFLQGVQDFELRSVLESLFGCLPNDDACENGEKKYPSAKELFLTASSIVWRSLPFVSWMPTNKKDKEVTKAEPLTEAKDSREVSLSTSSSHFTSVASLLMCEASLLPQVMSDSGSYALSATHHLLNETVLMFVPMDVLENTTELLKNSALSMTVSPVSVFWQLFDYVSLWGGDVMDEMWKQPTINYAIVDDDDFHFVVNVPKMRRPIMFVGIR